MPNRIRFATGTPDAPTTRIMEWETLVTDAHPELRGVRTMLAYGKQTKVGEALYQGDILILDASVVAKTDPFWTSSAGKKMKSHQFDAYVLHLTESAQQPLSAIVYAVKGGQAVTDSVFYTLELEDGERDDVWKETGADAIFIQYLLAKGATLLGNDWEHADILAPFIRKEASP